MTVDQVLEIQASKHVSNEFYVQGWSTLFPMGSGIKIYAYMHAHTCIHTVVIAHGRITIGDTIS